MRCTHCGVEIPDGSRFCDNCGARVEAPAASTVSTAASTPAAKPKKTNWLLTIVIGVVVYFLARGAGTLMGQSMANQLSSSTPRPAVTSSSQSSLPTIAPIVDLFSTNTVLKLEEAEGVTDYVAVYTGSDTGLVTKVCYVLRLDRNSGYDRSSVDNDQFRKDYPAFAQFSYYEEDNGDTICVITFDKMKDQAHMKAMADAGLLTPAPGTDLSKIDGIDAKYYIQSFRDQGYTDAPILEIGGLHLNG